MTKRTSRDHTATFKAKVALAAVKGEKPLAELAQDFDVHPTEVANWKAQLLEGAAGVFGSEARVSDAAQQADVKSRYAGIGELTRENKWIQALDPDGAILLAVSELLEAIAVRLPSRDDPAVSEVMSMISTFASKAWEAAHSAYGDGQATAFEPDVSAPYRRRWRTKP
jgi:transposase-like protein